MRTLQPFTVGFLPAPTLFVAAMLVAPPTADAAAMGCANIVAASLVPGGP